jgi:hypothetical protein
MINTQFSACIVSDSKGLAPRYAELRQADDEGMICLLWCGMGGFRMYRTFRVLISILDPSLTFAYLRVALRAAQKAVRYRQKIDTR